MSDTIQGFKRTGYCGEPESLKIGERASVCGFVQKIRDKGGLVFIDLRDRTGIVQLVFDEASKPGLLKKAAGVRAEYVLAASGIVRERASKNPDVKTGDVEIFADDMRILSKAETPPFEITETTNVNEELRLKYRYLDLRRGEMQKAMITRHKIVKSTRDFYDLNGFLEIETPVLIKSTPEGARDYLVPSRVHHGEFYALPQSPQLFKQLLMLSGYDRYMQIARCFRDEDLRADRQPEFTQIDVEMSFVDENDVMEVNEAFIKHVFKEVLNVDVTTPFKRIPYGEAMSRYGSDKPDTRFGLELCDLTEVLKDCGFKVFSDAAKTGSIRGINVKGAVEKLSRKEIDKLVEYVKAYKAKGIAFTRISSDSESSSFEKFLTESEKNAIRQALNAEVGDVFLIIADASDNVVLDSLGALRRHLAAKLGLITNNSFDFLWVVEFPLFEYDEDEGRYTAKHHPFTSPMPEDIDKIESEPQDVRARAYDMVLNGCEIGGGSIRINDPVLQRRMFQALGLSEETAKERFGFLLNAFEYGVPPHGGMAFGLDRLVMLMLGKTSIRDVIAFPKVQNARDLMIDCPSLVDEKSLGELGIAVKK